MYNNLKNVLRGKRITLKMFGEVLDITEKTAQNKVNGVTDFTYTEFKKTCTLLHEYSADFLFENEQQPQQTA